MVQNLSRWWTKCALLSLVWVVPERTRTNDIEKAEDDYVWAILQQLSRHVYEFWLLLQAFNPKVTLAGCPHREGTMRDAVAAAKTSWAVVRS